MPIRPVRLFVLFSILLAGRAHAGARDHDGGLFARVCAGGGTASTSIDLGSAKLKLSGGSGDTNLALGAIVSPNLALHGTIFGWFVSQPDVELAGAAAVAQGDLDLSAAGIGITYYFMPINLYLSPSFGVGWLTANGPDGEGTSEAGFAMDLSVGKEWWLGDRWGLGVTGAFTFHSIPEPGIPDNWEGTNVSLRFSATYN